MTTGQSRPGRHRLRDAGDVLLLASSFALLTGLVEAGRIGVIRLVLSGFVWLPNDAAWMAPLAYMIYFAVPAVVIAALILIFPRFRFWLAVFPFAFLTAFSLLTLFAGSRIATWAVLLLAAGLAVSAARWTRAHETRLRRLLLPANLIMGTIVVCLMAVLPGSRAWQRRATLAQLPEAQRGLTNVLLIILDTVRAANLSLYGYQRPTTPNLEQWAKRGVVFDHAFSTAPWTLPSHASLFTGLYPHELTASWLTPLSGAPRTLAEVYQSLGYHTAGFVANSNYAGLDSGLGRGFIDYLDYQRTGKQFFFSSSLGQILEGLSKRRKSFYVWSDRKPGKRVTAEFLNWQSSNRERPFFAFLNYYDAHEPYLPTAALRDKFKHTDRATGNYDGAIASLDAELNSLFKELDRRGVLRNTLVIVTSDHGELLGEHGLRSHGNSLYVPALHVPLVMFGPRVPQGRRVEQPVTLRDLPRTLLELAADNAELSGTSLAASWNGAPYLGSSLFAELKKGIRTSPVDPVSRGDMFSLTKDGWHYIRNGDGVEELYSLTSDPGQVHNLASEPAAQIDLLRMRNDATLYAASRSADALKAK